MHDSHSEPSDHQTGERKLFDVHPQVFFSSAFIIIGFVVLSVFAHEKIGNFFGPLLTAISTNAGWFFVLVVNLVLGFAFYLMFSRYGDIRLGGEDAEPDFSNASWFAMLFSAGIGIGLLFYGVAEPIFHFSSPPFPVETPTEAARNAMTITFLHWGFHGWGVYAIMALSLAFFSYNKGLPLSIRTAFYPLLGEKIHGFWGNVVDTLATVATLFGVATSLGIGVRQINAGLTHIFGIQQTPMTQILLIAGITTIATISVVKGLDAGIRRLSEINIWLASALLAFVMACGPTLFILNGVLENIGFYIQKFPQVATWNETFENGSWQNSWTVFYWAWWVAWSPFVGMFIARVSRGRTIREFLMGVLFVPTFVSFFWITVFGNSALFFELFGGGNFAEGVMQNVPLALFLLLERLPMASIMPMVAIVVIVLFFVTSSDSGSMVIDIITAGGNPDPPIPQRLFWAILEGVVAAALLLSGGLGALQSAVVATGLPFGIVVLVLCFSLKKGLNEYAGTQTFSVRGARAKGEQFQISASDTPFVRFGRRRS